MIAGEASRVMFINVSPSLSPVDEQLEYHMKDLILHD